MRTLSSQVRLWFTHPLTLLSLGLFPCVFCLFTVLSKYRQQEGLKRHIRHLYQKRQLNNKKTEMTNRLVERLKSADPDFVQHNLEKRIFLKDEIQRLEAIGLTGSQKAADIKRLKHLKHGGNHLKLSEKHFHRVGNWQEVEISQARPVEMGSHDLMGLLASIENVQIDTHIPDSKAPDFLIDDFEMIRKPQTDGEETFAIKFHCIKREYIHE